MSTSRRKMLVHSLQVDFEKPEGVIVLCNTSTGDSESEILPVADGIIAYLKVNGSSGDSNWLGIKRYGRNKQLLSDSKWNVRTTITPEECYYVSFYACHNVAAGVSIYAEWL